MPQIKCNSSKAMHMQAEHEHYISLIKLLPHDS